MRRPKLTCILASLASHLESDTEDLEGFNSIIKAQARTAPSIKSNQLSARCCLKGDIGHATKSQSSMPVRELMKVGQRMMDELHPFATSRKALKNVMSAKGRFSHATPLTNVASPVEVHKTMSLCDPMSYPDVKSDAKLNWASAHNKLFNREMKKYKPFQIMMFIGELTVGSYLFMPADNCRSVFFFVKWQIQPDGRLTAVLPLSSISSVDVFMSYFDVAHADGYESPLSVRVWETDWKSFKSSGVGDQLSMYAKAPGPDCVTTSCFDVVPGRRYATTERVRRLGNDAMEALLDEDNGEIAEDLRAAYAIGSTTLESELERVIESERADIGERDVDKREDSNCFLLK